MHDDDTVAHAEDLRHFGGDHDNAHALIGQLAHQLVDLALRADVDAARRLIEDQNLRVGRQPFADDDLLLVAAGEVQDLLLRTGRLDVELLDIGLGDLVFLLAAEDAALHLHGQARQRGVFPDGHIEDQAKQLPVFGDQAETCADGVGRRVLFQLFAVDDDLAAVQRVDAKDRAHDLAAARADQPGKAEDLTAVERKADVLHHLARIQMLCLEHGFADLGIALRVDIVERAADHHVDELRLGTVLRVDRADAFAVAQDRDAVADLKQLAQTVGNEDDRHALIAQIPDDVHEDLGLAVRQRGGRLVHDDQLRVGGQGLRHLHHLPLRDGQILDQRIDIGRQADHIGIGLRQLRRLLEVDEEAGLAVFPAQEDVLPDAHVGHEVQLLIDDADAHGRRFRGRVDLDGFAFPEDLAAVRLMHAGQDLHEGRFARAVLSDQRVHLAAPERKRNVPQRVNTRKGLVYVFHYQKFLFHVSSLAPPPGNGWSCCYAFSSIVTQALPFSFDCRQAWTKRTPSAPSCTVGKSIMPGSNVPSFLACRHSMNER